MKTRKLSNRSLTVFYLKYYSNSRRYFSKTPKFILWMQPMVPSSCPVFLGCFVILIHLILGTLFNFKYHRKRSFACYHQIIVMIIRYLATLTILSDAAMTSISARSQCKNSIIRPRYNDEFTLKFSKRRVGLENVTCIPHSKPKILSKNFSDFRGGHSSNGGSDGIYRSSGYTGNSNPDGDDFEYHQRILERYGDQDVGGLSVPSKGRNKLKEDAYYIDDEDDYYIPSRPTELLNSHKTERQIYRKQVMENIPGLSTISSGNRKVGTVLLGAGVMLTILGVSLFFNKTLLRIGNLLLCMGVPILIGPGRTAGYFLQPTKARATGCLLSGIFLVFIGWPILGISLEIFGLLNLFGNMFPFIKVILLQMPIVGDMIPHGKDVKSRKKRAASSRGEYEDDYNYASPPDEEARYY